MKISDLKSYTVLGNTPTQSAPQSPQPKSFGQKVLDVGTGVSNFFGGKGISDLAGATIAKIKAKPEEKQFVDFPSAKQVAGSALQLGANFIPGAGIGAKLGTKALIGAGTGLAMDVGSKLQNNQTPTPGIGTVVGGALPVAGAVGGYATRVMGRLFKGLGSGISGVSTKTLDEMLTNPKVAQKASDKLKQNGNFKVLEENAKNIVGGVSNIRKEARQSFGKGLETLAETDIDRNTFKDKIAPTLKRYGSSVEDGKRVLANVEFTDPKNLQKASELINKLSGSFKQKLDGKSVRKLADDIENAAYKTATSDERLSFNAFVKDLSDSLTSSIDSSTTKLKDINKAFSQDMQLAEAAEKIFGKVDYKNVSEVANAANKLEGLFNEKGLDPQTIDKFLSRIGISPQDFRTSEAVRQISNKEAMPPNTPGFNVGEIVRAGTSSIMTPETVKNITIKTGLTKEKLTPLLNGLKSLSPALQKTLIQALLGSQQ